MGEPGFSSRGVGPEGGADAILSPAPGSSLPLRLSLGRAGLAIELSRPLVFEAATVQELSLELEGLSYPIDLSRGVKQFLHRRTKATFLRLELNIAELAKWLPSLASSFPDGSVEFSVAPTRPDSEARIAHETSFSFSLRGERSALAWDMVLSVGESPKFVVDRARGLGLSAPPLISVLRILDAIAARAASALGEPVLRRAGRALVIENLTKIVLLQLMPGFAMRLPSVKELRFEKAEIAANVLSLSFALEPELAGIGRRGIRLAGLCELLSEADDLLVQGDVPGARARYLEALERTPGDRATLLALGELDSMHDDRGESALSFFDEAERRNPSGSGELPQAAELLAGLGRVDLAFERYLHVAELEHDPAIAAFALYFAHEIESNSDERLRLLSKALERAPSLSYLSLARFRENLRRGLLEGAATDAERYIALARDATSRSLARATVGEIYLKHGLFERAVRVLSLAHREAPDSVEVRYSFALALSEKGEVERAVQLWGPLVKLLSGEDQGSVLLGRPREDVVREIHFALAQAYAGPIKDYGLAVSELRAIETRGELGARARELEGQMFLQIGDAEGRHRAHVRLLEAIELNWVGISEGMFCLLSCARVEAEHGQVEFALRACGLVEERVRGGTESERAAATGFSQLRAALASRV